MNTRILHSLLLFLTLLLILPNPAVAQNQCIVLDCPETVTACPEGNGAAVTFEVTGTDICGTNLTILCTPPSGSFFPLGTNYVSCIATNERGDRASCEFPVVVGDREPPVLIFPARIITPCVGPDGAPVYYSVVVTDNCDTNVIVECTPPSGSVFPIGTNLVTCIAADSSGNIVRQTFPVIVAGGCGTDPCIRFLVPENLTVPCTSPAGAAVQFEVTATNACTGTSLPVVSQPPSGTVLPVGLHQVVCSAGQGAAPALASFIVEVVDDVPPVLDCPSNLVVVAQSPLGAVVFYQVTGKDDCAAEVKLRCSPPSGSAFPVGKTWVVCEGSDGHGNLTQCGFELEVTPPAPLRASLLANQQVELRWTGDAMLETNDRLDTADQWQLQPGIIQADGLERFLRIPATDSHRFFRILPVPLLPPPDEDADGVPDDRDRCPGTFPGAQVDIFGCAVLDFVATPEGIFQPERALAGEALRLLEIDGGFEQLIGLLLPAVQKFTDPVEPLLQHLLLPAVQRQQDHVESLRGALAEFQRQKPTRMAEILATAPRLDEENADVRPQDFDLMRLDDIESHLKKALEGSELHLNTLSNLNAAATGLPTRERVQVQSFDPRRGLAVLSDGRHVLLPRPSSPWDLPFSEIPVVIGPGSLVDVQFFPLPGGSLYGQSASPIEPTVDDIVHEVDPRCLRLRFVPAEVGLHLWDSGKRHKPLGYFWGATFAGSRYYLEQGMGLAVVKVSCPYEVPGAYKHWVKILKDGDNDGYFATVADYIDQNSYPVVLTPGSFPDSPTAFPILVREYRAPVLQGGNLGAAEVLAEESFTVVVRSWGYYANAAYSRTIFELEDRPASGEWQSAAVDFLNRRYPLTLKPSNEHDFFGLSYKVNGNASTYPNVAVVGQDEPFSVHLKDPNDDLFFAYSDDLGRGIYSPVVRGFRNGLIHQYRVSLPALVRDRIVNCSGTDTYYRIPFNPVLIIEPFWFGGSWNVSQGNNGTFTHNGWQAFAWDFPAAAGTTVRAARGGRVVTTRETSTLSCWNSSAQACQNCTGAASPNMVTILHQDGTTGVYLHFQNNSVIVSPGQRVYRGDPIAAVGTTGCSTGNHLHFHVVNQAGNQTVPARFEAYDSTRLFRQCYNPPAQSSGWSNNEPWNWPF